MNKKRNITFLGCLQQNLVVEVVGLLLTRFLKPTCNTLALIFVTLKLVKSDSLFTTSTSTSSSLFSTNFHVPYLSSQSELAQKTYPNHKDNFILQEMLTYCKQQQADSVDSVLGTWHFSLHPIHDNSPFLLF